MMRVQNFENPVVETMLKLFLVHGVQAFPDLIWNKELQMM